MIIIGHPWIESPQFRKIFNIDDIKDTLPTQIVLLEPLNESHAIAQYCQQNSISFAVTVNTLTGAIYANALGANYILCEEKVASLVQPIANEYLFDTKVLVHIENESEIPQIAQDGIDGVLYHEAIC